MDGKRLLYKHLIVTPNSETMRKFYFAYIPLYIVSLLPLWFLYGIFQVVYFFGYKVFKYRLEVTNRNVRTAFPEKNDEEIKEIVKGFYRSLARHLAEILKMVSISPKNLSKRVKRVNFEILEEYYDRGQNVLLAMGHCGNWETLNIAPEVLKHKMFAVYKPLKNKTFDNLMLKVRERFSVSMIPSKSVARHILTRKDDPALYLMLADQCPDKVIEKYRFPLFNHPTAMYNGVEKLAVGTGAAVVYCHILQTSRGHYTLTCVPITDDPKSTEETEITRKYSELLEANIREAPSDWLWSHRRWKR